jgi:hypothetical protein
LLVLVATALEARRSRSVLTAIDLDKARSLFVELIEEIVAPSPVKVAGLLEIVGARGRSEEGRSCEICVCFPCKDSSLRRTYSCFYHLTDTSFFSQEKTSSNPPSLVSALLRILRSVIPIGQNQLHQFSIDPVSWSSGMILA